MKFSSSFTMQWQSKTRPWADLVMSSYTLLSLILAASVLLTHTVAAAAGGTSELVQSITGHLYAENFTYYKLSGEGRLRLELYSLKGDVDLYVSGKTLSPSFFEYELKSETCGADIVDIPSIMSRPVGIGIYSHPSHLQSSFRMDIHLIGEGEIDEYEKLFKAFHYYDDDYSYEDEDSSRTKGNRKPNTALDSEEEEEESIWWSIIITIIKFILEVIV